MDRQYYGQKKKDKATNNEKQTKIRSANFHLIDR